MLLSAILDAIPLFSWSAMRTSTCGSLLCYVPYCWSFLSRTTSFWGPLSPLGTWTCGSLLSYAPSCWSFLSRITSFWGPPFPLGTWTPGTWTALVVKLLESELLSAFKCHSGRHPILSWSALRVPLELGSLLLVLFVEDNEFFRTSIPVGDLNRKWDLNRLGPELRWSCCSQKVSSFTRSPEDYGS